MLLCNFIYKIFYGGGIILYDEKDYRIIVANAQGGMCSNI
jgi:hypothetical protein